MLQLNLPIFTPKLKKTKGEIYIFDLIRKKYLFLTPEEWVRQNFTAYLINELKFPVSLMANEVSIKLNKTARRCDTIVYGSKGEPLVIIEYKAPTINITQKTFDQIVRYNMVLKAKYLVVSNGLTHYCCIIDYEQHSYIFIPVLPSYKEL